MEKKRRKKVTSLIQIFLKKLVLVKIFIFEVNFSILGSFRWIFGWIWTFFGKNTWSKFSFFVSNWVFYGQLGNFLGNLKSFSIFSHIFKKNCFGKKILQGHFGESSSEFEIILVISRHLWNKSSTFHFEHIKTIFMLLFWIIGYKHNHRKHEYCHLTNQKTSDFFG